MRKHDFLRDTKLKRTIELDLYEKARDHYFVVGDVITAAGPDIERHIKTARRTVACTESSIVKIVEIVKDRHDEQLKVFKKLKTAVRPKTWMSQSFPDPKRLYFRQADKLLPCYHNVELILSNITDVTPTAPFIDADLMTTFSSCGNELLYTLQKQRYYLPLGSATKGFIFTISLRGCTLKSSVKWVLEKLAPCTGGSAYLCNEPVRNLSIDRRSRKSSNGARIYAREIFAESSTPEILHCIRLISYSDGGGPMLTGILIYS
jgi:hypothetical protein